VLALVTFFFATLPLTAFLGDLVGEATLSAVRAFLLGTLTGEGLGLFSRMTTSFSTVGVSEARAVPN
jgi:hypothetical protein